MLALCLPRPAAHDFANPFAWDAAYASSGCPPAEWLLPYSALRPLLLELLPSSRAAPVLEIGCGTSALAAQLCADGFTELTACDASRVAVEASRRAFAHVASLRVVREDAREMSFADGSFCAAVDKGTLDAICSAEGYDYEAARVAAELVRVLRPRGRWVCVSLMPPAVLLPIMEREEWGGSLRLERRVGGHYVYAAERRG
ncbi:hypothetical protein AB1Y20_002709 [Prymnesium parvum]|uniref:Methyltransferase domain-containing protein n=1 Tax=Prymnesium parvum TaxID=97485 RepID=A0AB34JB62_PRYPA